MPLYTGTYRWLNPATSAFQPVTVRGVARLSSPGGVATLTYRDLYFSQISVPDPPIIVSVFFDSASVAHVEWQDGYETGNVISYHIKRGGVDISGALDPSLQTFTDDTVPTATPNPVIVYTMYAVTDNGTTADSGAFPVQWQGQPVQQKPLPPTNFRIDLANVTQTQIPTLWTMSSDPSVQGFRIYKNGNPGQLMLDTFDPTTRTGLLDGLTPSTTYARLNVRAYNSVGESQGSNQVDGVTADPQSYTQRFPGHQAGLVYLGVYSANAYGTEDTPIGTTVALDRITGSGLTTGTVSNHVAAYVTQVDNVVQDGKIPWISLNGINLGIGGTDPQVWVAVAGGQADAALKQYFDMISELSSAFCILTFNAKGNAAATTSTQASDFVAAVDAVGTLWAAYNNKDNGIYGPIMDSTYYTQVQAGQRSSAWFIVDELLDNAEFLGVDMYQTNVAAPSSYASTRLNTIVSDYATLTSHGDKMVGISDLAGANVFRNGGLYNGATIPANSLAPTGAQWLSEAMTYVFANRDRFFSVSAFDTSGLTTSPRWALDEAKVTTGSGTLDTVSKMEVYQGYITGTEIARQQGETVFSQPSVTASLDRSSYVAGNTMTMTVTSSTRFYTIAITDTGVTWTRQTQSGKTSVYTATSPSTAAASRTAQVRLTRTYDGRTATANATYAVTTAPPPPPPSSVVMHMGTSTNHAEGGVEDWDSYRLYNSGDLISWSNRTGTSRPKSILYSASGPPLGSSGSPVTSVNYTNIFNYVKNQLDNYYYGGTGQTHTIRWGIQIFWSNGNEMSDKGILGPSGRTNPPVTHLSPSAIADFVVSQHALWDACHLIDSSTGKRRYPDAFAGVDPTTFDEKQLCVQEFTDPTAQYLDFIAWSMYPDGRKRTNYDPTYNWPTFVESAKNTTEGWLIRCYARTKQAQTKARADSGDSTRVMAICTGEVGIGKAGTTSGNDPAARPYYCAYGLAGPMQTLANQYQIPQGPTVWWDEHLPDKDIPNRWDEEWAGSNPHSVIAWQHWRDYHTSFGGTKPTQWANLTAAQKDGWKHSGTTLS